MTISAIAVVYANLIDRGLKTEEKVPPNIRAEVMVVLCSRKIIAKEITFAAACGKEPDAVDEKYKNHKYTGFCKNTPELKEAVIEMVSGMGYSHLVKTVTA